MHPSDRTRKAAMERSTFHLLFECARLVDLEAQARVNREAKRVVLRPSYARLLPYLSVEGLRLTELARRVDVTKQAVTQAVGDMAELGIVELSPDPRDGRAKIVRLTPLGERAYLHGLSVLQGLEGELGKRLDKGAMQALHRTLKRLHGILLEGEESVRGAARRAAR